MEASATGKLCSCYATLELRGRAGGKSNKGEISCKLFLQREPLPVHIPLAIHKETRLSDLAEIANTVVEVLGPRRQVCESSAQLD